MAVKLESDPEKAATLLLFTNVENAAEIREAAVSGKIQAAVLDPTILVSAFQVLVAVNKAVGNYAKGQLITKNVYTEIIYSLSPSSKITDSLKHFGIKDQSKSILVVIVTSAGSNIDNEIKLFKDLVKGRMVDIQEMGSLTDHVKVKKIYGISEEELNISTIENSVVTQIAIKSVN